MAVVWIQACSVAPNITTNTYGSWCPLANRVMVQTTTEFLQLQNIVNPFVLTVADGLTLSLSIIGVWVSASMFRAFYRVINPNQDGD